MILNSKGLTKFETFCSYALLIRSKKNIQKNSLRYKTLVSSFSCIPKLMRWGFIFTFLIWNSVVHLEQIRTQRETWSFFLTTQIYTWMAPYSLIEKNLEPWIHSSLLFNESIVLYRKYSWNRSRSCFRLNTTPYFPTPSHFICLKEDHRTLKNLRPLYNNLISTTISQDYRMTNLSTNFIQKHDRLEKYGVR